MIGPKTCLGATRDTLPIGRFDPLYNVMFALLNDTLGFNNVGPILVVLYYYKKSLCIICLIYKHI